MSSPPELKTLWRPVGMREMQLILASGAREFSLRTAGGDDFFPLLDPAHAGRVAREWNAERSADQAGVVAEFDVDAAHAARFKEHTVGPDHHRELWVPGAEMEEFNRHIVPPIRIRDIHYGPGYTGPEPSTPHLRGLAARDQLPRLAELLEGNPEDFLGELRFNPVLVQLNFKGWVTGEYPPEALPREAKLRVLREIQRVARDMLHLPPLAGSDLLIAL